MQYPINSWLIFSQVNDALKAALSQLSVSEGARDALSRNTQAQEQVVYSALLLNSS